MTAGHNALRGSGPGPQHAFDDAMALDWDVLTAGLTGSALRAVRPPNPHITPDDGAIWFTAQVLRVVCNVPLDHGPGHPRYLVRESRRITGIFHRRYARLDHPSR